jgi:hypothetical protein
MVDFRNPVTFVRELGAYALSSGRGFTVVLLNSGDRESLAHHGRYIYVSFPVPASRALLDFLTAAFHV